MEFYNRSHYPKTIAYPKSEPNVPVFALKIDKDTGKKELKKTGATNLYEKIQASKEGTLIYNILERFNNGDNEALNKTKGTYGDFSQMPKTLAEAQQSLIDAENAFNELPLDVRREFNMSTSEFLAALTNGKFEAVMTKLQPQKQKAEEINQNQIGETTNEQEHREPLFNQSN